MTGLGRPTRGKTRPGRLRLLDPWLLRQLPDGPARLLDVGIGASPDTTLEWHEAARRAHGPAVTTLGIDLDEARVAALAEAAASADGLRALHRSFDHEPEPAYHVVRAANLLRQYRLDDVPAALDELAAWLVEGGLLVEGSTDRAGDRGCFRAFRVRAGRLVPAVLVFVVDLHGPGFAPRALTPYLPRGLGWHGHPGPELERLFAEWTRCFGAARSGGSDTARALFVDSAEQLAREGVVEARESDWRAGRMIVPAWPGATWGERAAPSALCRGQSSERGQCS